MNKNEIDKQKIVRKLRYFLLKEKNILFAYLHGSFVDGNQFNDIDISIYLDERGSKKINHADFEISFSLSLEKAINIPVDVKILNNSPLSFRYHATKGHLLLSRDDSTRAEFLRRTWNEYLDFLPVSKIYLEEIGRA